MNRHRGKIFAVIVGLFAILMLAFSSSASASSYQYQLLFGYGAPGHANITAYEGWASPVSYDHGTGCYESGLNLQTDGNLVQYVRHSDVGTCPGSWSVAWATNTFGPSERLVWQADNNWVLYDANWNVLMASNTFTNYATSSYFQVRTNGCAVILDVYMHYKWSRC